MVTQDQSQPPQVAAAWGTERLRWLGVAARSKGRLQPSCQTGLVPSPLRLLLTGPPGIGKSTVAERVVDQLRSAGVPVGGFITRELREEGRRVGFVADVINGASALLAHVSFTAGPQVGRYRVDVAAFEQAAVPALAQAVERRDLLLIDEIGRMELAAPAFVAVLDTIFAVPVYLLATVHQVPHPVTDTLKQRPDVEVVHVSRSNRDALADVLSTRLLTAWRSSQASR